jgi:hypothetical protein
LTNSVAFLINLLIINAFKYKTRATKLKKA